MDRKQTVSIYRNRKTGEFRIQPFGRLPNGSSQACGEPDRLPNTASNEQLLSSLIENLAKNEKQIYNEAMVPRIPPEERRRVFKEDQLVSVWHQESKYRIIPFKRMGNSFGSIDDMIRVVSEGEFHNKGGEIIRSIFDEIL